MKRIVITGPESSGKTTLANQLARTFDTLWVPEYARAYLAFKGTAYQLEDLTHIAIGQLALRDAIEQTLADKPCVFLDTWMLELEIWAQYRFDAVPDVIRKIGADHPPDLYVLCTPDLPWEPDPLRENPHDRGQLFESYSRAVSGSHVPGIIVSGSGPQRVREAEEKIGAFIVKNS